MKKQLTGNEIIQLCTGPNLFIDDYLIDELHGLIRVTHQPEKFSEPVLRTIGPSHLQPQWFMKVNRDPNSGLFRSWYNLKNFTHGGPSYSPALCYAYSESRDGIKWDYPNLGLIESNGSKDNNIIDAPLGHFGLFMVDEGSNYKDRTSRYKMAYYDGGLSVAFSQDGFHFVQHNGNPVLCHSVNNIPFNKPGYENVIGDIIDGCWDPFKCEYLLGCKLERNGYSGKPHHHEEGWRRCVGMSTSRDFITWEKPRLIITPDPENGLEEFYGFKPMILGNLYLGFLRVLRDDLPATQNGPVEGIGWTELLTSRDGLHWIRHQDVFINRNTRPDTWDHAMAWYADSITVGNQEFIYYGGYSEGHKVGGREVGLAKLRKNGFVSRYAGKDGGWLKTPLIKFPGKCLNVNADVRGELRIRLLDSKGEVIPGFDWQDCVSINGNSICHEVLWHDCRLLPSEGCISLQFLLRDTDLYSFDIM